MLVRRRGRPLIVWQRILGFPPQMWRPVRQLRWRAVVRRIDAAVALTPDLGDELRQLGFAGPIWAIPNFRDPEPFLAVDRDAAGPRPPRRARDRGRRRPDRLRRPPDRAEAARPRARHARAVHELGEPAHLVVAGDGPLRTAFEHDVAARGLGESRARARPPRRHRADPRRGRRVHPHERLGGPSRRADRGADGRLRDRHRAGRRRARARRRRRDGCRAAARSTTEELAGRVVELLRDPELRRRLGERARAAVRALLRPARRPPRTPPASPSSAPSGRR